jgi:hypothetical protein
MDVGAAVVQSPNRIHRDSKTLRLADEIDGEEQLDRRKRWPGLKGPTILLSTISGWEAKWIPLDCDDTKIVAGPRISSASTVGPPELKNQL